MNTVGNHHDPIRFNPIQFEMLFRMNQNQSELGLILTVFPILINSNRSDHEFILIAKD